ncbi:L-dopachrome tautomerase-related protein [Comamonas sp. BIGb0124]|uniref:L-dopachrome tautomerase-related protein n=1 Tax=Comamonas sp. BIGb0124 TaxID=2485130 RepID=UPI000F46E79A|nr:L-dopachrome tautomerase-related protein [Comamonas sp. BIGb0124]
MAAAALAWPVAALAVQPGELQVVAELPLRPGNVAVSKQGRVFATVHPLDAPRGVQLIEVTAGNRYRAWPGTAVQSDGKRHTAATLDSPLGIYIDGKNRLWIADMGFHVEKTRIWAFDISTGKQLRRIELPADIAPKGSFIQDLVVDDKTGWIYLADIAKPGLIAVEIATGKSRRFGESPVLQAEPNAVMRIGGQDVQFQGQPAAVGVNPITLSADGQQLFFGAMTGTRWYSVPTRLFRDGATDETIAAAIRQVGDKPISDGATTTAGGSHFFTNMNENGIDRLEADGRLTPVVRDARLDWPDSVRFGADDWLYIAVNQLHRSQGFSGTEETGKPPYRIMRVWTGDAKP